MAESNSSSWVNKHIVPVAGKISQFRPLIAIRDGLTLALPLIIIGSFFTILASFPITAWTNFISKTVINNVSISAVFAKISNGSFGIMGLVAAFGVAQSYASQKKVDGTSAGILSAAAFFIVTPSITSSGKTVLEGMPYKYLGSNGLFVAIIIGLISASIYHWFIAHHIEIKMPDSVPPAVAKSFSALLPGAAIILFAGAVYALFSWAGWGNIHEVFINLLYKPLSMLSDTLWGTLISIFLLCAFWFVGIHGASIVNTALNPMWLMQTDANRVLYQAHHLDLAHGGHIIDYTFINNFVYMGGGGATLGLVISIGILVMIKKANPQYKVLAPLTIIPGLFNINEPVIFGLPVVLNFTILIPFILVPMVNAVTTYIAMATGLVPLCTGTVIPWTMPPIISGFLATNSWLGSALQVINIIIDTAIYFPFVAAINRQELAKTQMEA
ncbi:PTS sugar transporter subunit IIC [Lactobacillus corticis]|uniref:Permease IIC component n=1 Tax=Lactobacillus corticis TaxID=2201249 RepID=A0A916QI97_9LACO|nr:PTS sugar transporter subunit IIC [Lactobacillus corticis]GFZ27459.1 cellobiose-specific PTS system IIC component [Lactobacillus corticis]